MTKTAKTASRSTSRPVTKKSGATKAITKAQAGRKAGHPRIPAVAANVNKETGILRNLNNTADASRIIPKNRTAKTATYQKRKIVSKTQKTKTAHTTKKVAQKRVAARPAGAKKAVKRSASKKAATKKH